MTDVAALLDLMSPEQRESVTAMLLQKLAEEAAPAPVETPTPSAPALSYYNMDDAVAVTFKATLSVLDKSRDKSYAAKYDHVWCKGHYRVKGPKGGVYFVGRCVMGVKKGQQVKGTLRVANKHFETFVSGAALDAWFRPDGAADAVLIGQLSNFRSV